MENREQNKTLSSAISKEEAKDEQMQIEDPVRLELGTTELPKLKKGTLFIDRSSFIQRIINDGSEVLLFTRPRRFMKTSNLRTLYYFFSKEVDNVPTAGLFDDMELKNLKDSYGRHIISTYQGQYPVVWLSFKDISGDTFEKMYDNFKVMMSEAYSQCIEHLIKDMKESEQDYCKKIISQTATRANFNISIKKLTALLRSYHPQGQKAILLIDEYDHPISQAYSTNGSPNFVEDMVNLTRDILNPALKDNSHLEKAVLTGILRISSATIFSGLNNLQSSSLLDPQEYGDTFGFTEKEVKSLMERLKSPLSLEDIKRWFNGYLINNDEIYNPWGILSALKKKKLEGYWAATGAIRMIKRSLGDMLETDIAALRKLVEGKTQVELRDEFPYTSDTKDLNSIYHLLWFAGYLRPASQIIRSGVKYQFQIKLVNQEVFEYFSDISGDLMTSTFSWTKNDWMQCIKCLAEVEPPNVPGFVKNLRETILIRYMSFRDGQAPNISSKMQENTEIVVYENFYQGLMLGFFICMSANYAVSSNIETGLGYSDYLVKHKSNKEKWAFVVELKRVKELKALKSECKNGMDQIKKKKYATLLKGEGYKYIKGICLCFYYKEVEYLEETLWE